MSLRRSKDVGKGLRFSKPSLCQAHLAKYQDVNSMIARAVSGDQSVYRRGGRFFDASTLPGDYQSCLNLGIEARNNWNSLPLEIRKRYQSPAEYLAALSNPEEREFLEKSGVFKTPEKTEPVEVRIVTPEGAAAADAAAHAVNT